MPPFTEMVPVRMRRATARARSTSVPTTAPDRPNSELLAMATASSSPSCGITARTGPNTSSWAMVESWSTPTSTLGSTRNPPRDGPEPPPRGDGRTLVAPDEHRRPDENPAGQVALECAGPAAGDDRRALVDRRPDVAEHPVLLRLADQRAHEVRGVGGVAP